MSIEIITLSDFEKFKAELLVELQKMAGPVKTNKKFHKSSEVKELLTCSDGTLQNYRRQGVLTGYKLGGSWYYDEEEILAIFN